MPLIFWGYCAGGLATSYACALEAEKASMTFPQIAAVGITSFLVWPMVAITALIARFA